MKKCNFGDFFGDFLKTKWPPGQNESRKDLRLRVKKIVITQRAIVQEETFASEIEVNDMLFATGSTAIGGYNSRCIRERRISISQ